jgi:predicted RNA-binding Zn ribbon-like protein
VARYDLPRAAEGPLRLVQLFDNTVDLEHGREWLATPADLAAWLRERGLGDPGPVDAAGLDRALALREALRALLRANGGEPVDAAAVAVVNRAAAGVSVRVGPEGGAALEVAETGVDAALARIVAVVLAAMLDGSWRRLKVCRQCRWAFWDGSRNRSAAWCSMQLCGNRTKTRAYRRRAREGV